MTYVSDELLTETPSQSFRASTYDMPNVEVEDNEINIRIAAYESKRKSLGWRMKQRVTEATGTDIVTTKEGARQLNTEERLVLKQLREIFKTKAYDIPSVKNVDWKKTKREVELVNSVTANVKTNSESEDNVG